MRLSDMTPAEFAAFLENLVTLLAGTKLSAIAPNVRADLLTAFGTIPADLGSATADATTQINLAEASVAARNDLFELGLSPARQVRAFLEAGNASKEQYDLAGFPYPAKTRSTYQARTPLDLQVTAVMNGVNRGKFKGNNSGGSVLFEVWRCEGDDGEWIMRLPVISTKFTDEGVVPGQHYQYKVRARAARSISDFSHTAVVYGVH